MGRGGNRGRGGGRGRGRGGGGGRGGGRGGRGGEDNRVSFANVDKTNGKLEGYYNEVLGLDEAEREDFWAAYKRELPNSFRFAGSKGHALAVQKQLVDRYIPEISRIAHRDGTLVEVPQPVTWYPDNLAWWMTTPKSVIRKFPPFAAFQKYLVSETSVGNISRQEVVSMIPPLVMDLRPGMTVLDMCAAPGSKAAQLLEMVHRGEESRVRKSLASYAEADGREASPDIQNGESGSTQDPDELVDLDDYGRATGLLIANDSDYKRSHMLIHQLKRLSSPNLIVTNHDATMFPSIKLPATPENPSVNRYLKFDRILADVPCSGDGTMRKNVNLWNDWNPGNALGLYITQVRILVRALQMLKVGGRVVYSTCSMNPVENEAVIASAIERCGGLEKVELLPTDDKLPLLKRKNGLKTWSIMDKAGRVWDSHEQVEANIEAEGSDPAKEKLVLNMFPPLAGSPGSKIPFERCIRVYAHQQDTGGFFIAILEKKTEFRAKPEQEPREPKDTKKPDLKRSADELESADAPDSPKRAKTEPETAENSTDTPISKEEEVIKSEPDTVENGADTPVIKDEEVIKNEPEVSKIDAARPAQRNRAGQVFEEPFKYISGDHPEVKSIESFYHLSPRFPRDRFMVRNATGEPAKTIYYSSALIRDILTENEGKGIKFIHGGVKMFMKQDVQSEGVCKWRIQSEGMPILEGYVGEERVVRLYKKETLRKLLIEMFPKLSNGAWEDMGEIGERVNAIGMGCCVLRVEPSKGEGGFQERIVMPLWRSMHSLNLMLAKEDRTAMLLRIFNDTTPLVNNHNPTQKAAEERKAKGEEESIAKEDTEDAVESHSNDNGESKTGEEVDTAPQLEAETTKSNE